MPRPVIETLISRQLHQYNRLRAILREDPERATPPRGPVITVSRMAGCCARTLAGALAERLGVQVWGRELVDRIASDKNLRHDVVARLDDGLVSEVDNWVRGMLGRRLFMRDDYAQAMAATIRTLAETGGAVIVGRGAGFVLGDLADLRLRLVAGDRHRAEVLRRARNISRDAALEYMQRTDAARAAFIRSYFQADVDDPRHYDIVLNTEQTDVGVMVEICECMVRARRLARGDVEAPLADEARAGT